MSRLYLFYFITQLGMGAFWVCAIAVLLGGGLSLSQTCLAWAVFSFSIALLELPTGVIADRWGRKKSTLLGWGIMGLGFLSMFFFEGTLTKFASMFVVGLGMTLESGASQAWFVAINNNEDSGDLSRLFLNLELFGRGAIVLGAVIAPQILKVAPNGVWGLVGCLALISILVGSTLPECRGNENSVQTKQVASNLLTPFLLPFTLAAVFSGVEFGVRDLIIQPYLLLTSDGLVEVFTISQIILSVSRVLGNLTYRNFLKKKAKGSIWLGVSLLIFSISQFVAFKTVSFWGFISVYSLAIFSYGWFLPVSSTLINERIDEHHRASALSALNMLTSLLKGVVALVLAYTLKTDNLQTYWLVPAVASLFGAGLYFFSGLVVERK